MFKVNLSIPNYLNGQKIIKIEMTLTKPFQIDNIQINKIVKE